MSDDPHHARPGRDRPRPSPPVACCEAIRHRAETGDVQFRLVVLNPARAELHLLHPERHDKATEAEEVLRSALPRLEQAAGGPVIGIGLRAPRPDGRDRGDPLQRARRRDHPLRAAAHRRHLAPPGPRAPARPLRHAGHRRTPDRRSLRGTPGAGSEAPSIHPPVVVPPHDEKRHHGCNRDQHAHADLKRRLDCAHVHQRAAGLRPPQGRPDTRERRTPRDDPGRSLRDVRLLAAGVSRSPAPG